MKKFLILILTLACLVSLIACNDGEDNGGNNSGDGKTSETAASTKTFDEAVKASKPASKSVVLTWGADYKGEATVTCNADGTEAITYSYTYPNTVSASSTEATKTDTGSVTRAADGTFPEAAPGWLKNADGIQLNLDATVWNSLTYTVNGNTLVGEVPAAESKNALGITLSADATLTVILSGNRVAKTVVNFENDGAWEISTTYTYAD